MLHAIIRYFFSCIIPAILGVALELYIEGITLDLQGFTWWVPVVCGFAGLGAVLLWDVYKGTQLPVQVDDIVAKERQKEWENLKFNIIKKPHGYFFNVSLDRWYLWCDISSRVSREVSMKLLMSVYIYVLHR